MAGKKKAWNLQNFQAHSADVKCLGLGHKSGRVMVTGGDDCKVNLWLVEKPHCIMSLTGHTRSVESVRFDHNEEMVAAGSVSGALKIWDLKQAKFLRTLTGHKSGVKSLDFHPYGSYVASGSLDSNVKLWDIRRKGCISTYKGHTGCVNSLKFTPDGKWIATGSDDSTVKIWDLTAGKLLKELKLHTGSVNAVEFHPSELLLTSGSTDKTVKFWDLESFECVSSSDPDKQSVQNLLFHPEGSCLYSVCGDTLKVYGWEPFVCHDVVPTCCSEVADMACANTQLIAGSYNKTNVSVFVVDLTKLAPTGVTSESENVKQVLQSSSGRRSFVLDHPQASGSKNVSEPKHSEKSPDKNDINDESPASQAVIQNQDDYQKFFRDKDKNSGARVNPFQAPLEDDVQVKAANLQPAPVKKEVSLAAAPSVQNQVRESINIEDFYHKQKPADELSEKEMIDLLSSSHTTMDAVLTRRRRNLQIVKALWRSGDIRTAIHSAMSMNDPAVMIDILQVINEKSYMWTLGLSVHLLPQLRVLMASKYESHTITAANSIKMILRNFADVIKANMQEPPSSFVDISREERQRKCLTCYNALRSIKAVIISTQPRATPKQAAVFKEVMLLMARLE